MNALSWLIYAAQLAEVFQALLGAGAAVCVVLMIVGLISSADEKDEEKQKDAWAAVKVLFFLALGLGITAAIIPSRQTLTLIAASEFGERAITSEAVRDIANPAAALIRRWLDQQMREATP